MAITLTKKQQSEFEKLGLADPDTLIQPIYDGTVYKEGVLRTESSVFNQHLPESLTPELVQQYHEYNNQYIAASLVAVTQRAKELRNGQPDLTSVTAHIGMGYNGLYADINFDQEVRNPGTGATMIKPVQVTFAHTLPLNNAIKNIRKELSEMTD